MSIDKRNLAKFEAHTIYNLSIIIKIILTDFGQAGMLNYERNYNQILGI